MKDLTPELILYICKYLDISDISKLVCINKKFNKIIYNYKWEIIDYITNYVPKNINTYVNYKYTIDIIYIVEQLPKTRTHVGFIIDLINTGYLNINYVAKYVNYPFGYIREIWREIDIFTLLDYQILPKDILIMVAEEYKNDYVVWNKISSNQLLSLSFLETYKNNINWQSFSSNWASLNRNTIIYFANKLNWILISQMVLDDYIIINCYEYISNICWVNISCFSKLSSDFVLRNHDKLNIKLITIYQKLDEWCIRHLIYTYPTINIWNELSIYQSLSHKFINDFRNKLDTHLLISNKLIKRSLIAKIYESK